MLHLRTPGVLDELEYPLRVVVETVAQQCPWLEFEVLEGMRAAARAEYLRSIDRSETGAASKHCRYPSAAVDMAPRPIDWKDVRRFAFLGGAMMATAAMLGVPLRWGGDWDTDGNQLEHKLWDAGHFELPDDWTEADRKEWEKQYAASSA